MTAAAARRNLERAVASFGDDWLDPRVEDIFVVRPGSYYVRRGTETLEREAPSLDLITIEALAVNAGHLRGQDVGEESPVLDCELPSGERLSAVLYPATPEGLPSLAIRRAMADEPDLDTLRDQGLFDLVKRKAEGGADIHEERIAKAKALLASGDGYGLLLFCIENRWTVVFGGEVGSGKTTDMIALAKRIPLHERVVTVADTEELSRLPHRNRVSFLHTKDGPVPAERLIEAALRNGPRWLLVPEVRGAEAFSFLRALASGHPGMTSLHCRTARDAFKALTTMIRQHPSGAAIPGTALQDMLASLIDVVVHVERGSDGQFRVTDIAFGREITA